ncbi:unnamed protein product [Cochlearia groenlandica]
MEQDQELWRTLKCAGKTQEKTSSVDTIMLKYRPIAPKPTTTTGQQPFAGETSSTRSRTKRKYVRVSKNNKATCRSKNGFRSSKSTAADPESISQEREDIVTLQLMPEKSDLYESTPLSFDHNNNNNLKTDTSSDENQDSIVGSSSCLDRTVVIESWLTVECVSDTCTTNLGGFLSRIEQREERVMRMLEDDTCPWLISDELNRVYWVNQAYRKMMGNVEEQEVVIKVWLVVTMKLIEEITCMVELYGAVTCRVRVTYEPYTWRKDNGDKSEVKMTVPCDVWRMGSSGGFAWRLDLQSALTLGR